MLKNFKTNINDYITHRENYIKRKKMKKNEKRQETEMRMKTGFRLFLQEIKSKKAIELKFKTSNKQTINLFFLKQIFLYLFEFWSLYC